MKQYICLNHGECNWADETPPREFTLPEEEENACPNCESTNVRESLKKSSNKSWLLPAVIIALVCLAGIIWWVIPSPSTRLEVKVIGLDCQTGVLSLTATGGNGSPIVFKAEGLSSGKKNNEFSIPINQRNGKKLKLFAMQGDVTVDTIYSTSCTIQLPPEPPPGPKVKVPVQITYRKVEGSDFCVSDCVLSYSEIDNLGRIRERRIENYAKCCPASK